MIRADEVREKVLAEHAEAVRKAERAIDAAILRTENPGRVVVHVQERLHAVVCERLVELYAEGGWHVLVQHHDCQREGSSTEFTLTAAPALQKQPPTKRWPMRGDRDVMCSMERAEAPEGEPC